MKAKPRFSSLLAANLLLAGSLFMTPALAGEHGRARQESQQGWLSLGQVIGKLEAAGYRNIERIEREKGGYEARATDSTGTRIKLRIHPLTGEVMDRREKTNDGATNAECTKRRCRDDRRP